MGHTDLSSRDFVRDRLGKLDHKISFIKETFVNGYGIREISLLPKQAQDLENENVEAIVFHSVDQIITEQLTNIESKAYNKQLLLDIYRNL